MADALCQTPSNTAATHAKRFTVQTGTLRTVLTTRPATPLPTHLHQVKTARLFLRDVTAVSPLSLLLFGGPLTVLHAEGAVLVGAGPGLGPGVRVACRAQTAVLVKQLRAALDRQLEQRFCGGGGGRGREGQGGGGGAGGLGDAVVAAVRQMLREEDEQRGVAARLA